MKSVVGLCGLAAVLWFVMFSPITAGHVPFWRIMTICALLLAAAGSCVDPTGMRRVFGVRWWHVPVGILAAAVLYVVFWVGHSLSVRLFAFADDQVRAVYARRPDTSGWGLAALLVCIGSCEEVFWRGFVQRRLARRWGPWAGLATATVVYALVHIWSGNLMLLAAAGLCGLFWGAMLIRFGSVWPALVSHALWDVMIFVLWPLG